MSQRSLPETVSYRSLKLIYTIDTEIDLSLSLKSKSNDRS